MHAQSPLDRPTRVAIIDDTEDLRFLLRLILTRNGMEVVGEAGDGYAGLELVRETRPDVVMLDLSMPVMDGRTALPLILRAVPRARVVVLTGFGSDELADELIEMGAVGYIQKGTTLLRIAQFVQDIARDVVPTSHRSEAVLRLVPDLAS